MPIYVRFRELTGHPVSAFTERCSFPPVMSVIGGKADVQATWPGSPLLATSGHFLPIERLLPHYENRLPSAVEFRCLPWLVPQEETLGVEGAFWRPLGMIVPNVIMFRS